MRIILVTGSRDWKHAGLILHPLVNSKPDLIIHGACPTGVDAITERWARSCKIFTIPMPAQWKKHGKSAGPKRNGNMVAALHNFRACGHYCEVLAFPMGTSPGTRDCMGKAAARNFKVIDGGSI